MYMYVPYLKHNTLLCVAKNTASFLFIRYKELHSPMIPLMHFVVSCLYYIYTYLFIVLA